MKAGLSLWSSRILTLAYGAVIIYLSHQPSISFLPSGFNLDKLYHLTEYFLLTGLATLGWRTPKTVLFLILFALSDELHQAFVPGRDCSMLDFAADCAGIFACMYFAKHKDKLFSNRV